VANDDRGAFELLVRRCEVPLRNFLRRLARGDFARADDIAQETMIKVYRSLASFKGTASFQTWLYRIAYNAFLDDERRRREGTEFSDAEHAAEVDFTDQAHTAMDVAAALQRLSTRQQAVFDLYYKKDMSHSELSEALDMPIGTVKSDLTRGHAKLKEILQKWGFDNDESN
jgi:RNA polymerase sigma-70 factor (ECF subfamily)